MINSIRQQQTMTSSTTRTSSHEGGGGASKVKRADKRTSITVLVLGDGTIHFSLADSLSFD